MSRSEFQPSVDIISNWFLLILQNYWNFSQISFPTCKFLHAWLTVSFCLLNSWNRDKQTFVQWRHSSTLEWQVQYQSSSWPYILNLFSLQLGFRGRNLVKGVKILSLEHSRSTSKNKSVEIFIKWKTGFLKKLTAEDENQERGWSISLNLEADTLNNWPKSEWFFCFMSKQNSKHIV